MDAMDETIQMAKELIAILGSTDSEIIEYQSMPKTATAWQDDCHKVNLEVQETIKALSSDLDSEKEELAAVREKTNAVLKRLSEEMTQSQGLNSQLSQQISSLRSKLEEIQSKAENLSKERTRKKEENSQDLASLRYKINLYSHVTNIKWDYSAADDDIRGYITNKDKVTPFQMSTKQNSRYFIANHLWDLMES